MKRSIAILLAMLYITLTSGVAVNVHYCMGKLASVEWQEGPSDMCHKCGKPVNGMDCCKDEFKFCKVTESHQAPQGLQQELPTATDMQLPVRILTVPSLSALEITITGNPHDPPDILSAPLFLKNCTFLI